MLAISKENAKHLSPVYSLDTICPQYTHLFHREEQNTPQSLTQLLCIPIASLIKRLNTPRFRYLPLWTTAKESSLIDTPGGNVVQRTAYVEITMFANVAVVQCTIQDLMLIAYVTVDVVDGISEFVTNNNLPFALLTLLDEINDNDGTAISFEQVLKVCLCRLIGWIHSIEYNGRFWHGH